MKSDSFTVRRLLSFNESQIAILALAGIVTHILVRASLLPAFLPANIPLFVVLGYGGGILVYDLLKRLQRREFGSDLLAGLSIVTAVLLEEYLAGSLVVLMLSGGQALERFAIHKASSALQALARRMPHTAHRKLQDRLETIPIDQILVGDLITIFPHEVCPCDGIVVEGHGSMDEAYLTGEPFLLSKTPGSEVISGAVNGEYALTIQATRKAEDSRYARIATVMKETQQARIPLRRLGDQLGAWYTPIAIGMAALAWGVSGEVTRFLAVLVVATPCPLLIAIPVAIIGSISLAAKRSIIIRDPAALERMDQCRTIIFDKTGTLTYGIPVLSNEQYFSGFSKDEVLRFAATVEQYSKHPLAQAVFTAAKDRKIPIGLATKITEPPGTGLRGEVDGHMVQLTSRKHLQKSGSAFIAELPPTGGGLECVILIDERLAGLYQFRDMPRHESQSFIEHLGPRHSFKRVMIVSGDRESEVRYLADLVGIKEIYASQTPEEKVAIVQSESKKAYTLYLGDGINDAPALLAATVGVAFGNNSDVTSQAAAVVVMEPSLGRVDELLHIAVRMKRIALQSALGGMLLSMGGMSFAAFGFLPPVAGALFQEGIDLFAVFNALRAGYPPRLVSDYNDFTNANKT
jgi:heavy metal translocating P-type ATPase